MPALSEANTALVELAQTSKRVEIKNAFTRFLSTPNTHFSPEIIAEADEFLLDEVFSDADHIASIALSLREATRRSERAEIRLRLSQLRDILVHAIRCNKLLSNAEPDAIAGSGSLT